jgi:hypothetical protein
MNPNTSQQPSFELPAPVAGNQAVPERGSVPEISAQPQPTSGAQQAQPVPQPQFQPAAGAAVDPAAIAPATPAAAPLAADDADLIEKEWVEKAKAIVASTRHDPHIQNRELNKFKADYLQKRYNKTIKVDEA